MFLQFGSFIDKKKILCNYTHFCFSSIHIYNDFMFITFLFIQILEFMSQTGNKIDIFVFINNSLNLSFSFTLSYPFYRPFSLLHSHTLSFFLFKFPDSLYIFVNNPVNCMFANTCSFNHKLHEMNFIQVPRRFDFSTCKTYVIF